MKMVYACTHALLSVCRDMRCCVFVQYQVQVVHKHCFSRLYEDGKILSALLFVLMASIPGRHTFFTIFIVYSFVTIFTWLKYHTVIRSGNFHF